eukprot:m.232317 g.232317  ORF g.232317 m.232317 type:complete len:55 (+) comp18669_c0_seq1:2499-2663(+)
MQFSLLEAVNACTDSLLLVHRASPALIPAHLCVTHALVSFSLSLFLASFFFALS